MIFPDIFAINQSRKKHLLLWESISPDQMTGLFAFQKIKTDSVKWHPDQLLINIPDISKICLQQNFTASLICQDLVINPME